MLASSLRRATYRRARGLIRRQPIGGLRALSDSSSDHHHSSASSDDHDNTYYDSQSGQHVPIHNETEISLFLHASKSTIPHKLYEDSFLDQLKDWQKAGTHGLILPPVEFPSDGRNLVALTHIVPENFRLFSFDVFDDGNNTNVSVLLNYSNDKFEESLKWHVEEQYHTTILLEDECFTEDPVMLANNVAAFIDSHGGGDFIWLAPTQSPISGLNADDVVRLAEELNYLDLPGATVQSRLLVNAVDEDLIEEIMSLGVNKFVVDVDSQQEQVEMVQQIAEEQGKKVLTDES